MLLRCDFAVFWVTPHKSAASFNDRPSSRINVNPASAGVKPYSRRNNPSGSSIFASGTEIRSTAAGFRPSITLKVPSGAARSRKVPTSVLDLFAYTLPAHRVVGWNQSGDSVFWSYGATIQYQGSITGASIQGTKTITSEQYSGAVSCTLQKEVSEPQVSASADEAKAPSPREQEQSSERVAGIAKQCVASDTNYIRSVSLTNKCSYNIDATWCFRKHNSGEPYRCKKVLNWGSQHTLETGGCYQCTYDTAIVAFPTSQHHALPTEAQINAKASPSKVGVQSSPTSGTADDSSLGLPRWKFTNTYYSSGVTFELRDGDATSTGASCDSNEHLLTQELGQGQSYIAACGEHQGFCVRWKASGTSYSFGNWVGLSCSGSNPIWTRSDNMREYEF